jgi:hypothetical protein
VDGKEVAAILIEALDDAKVPEEQKGVILSCFAAAMGRRLARDLDTAVFNELVSGIES